MSLPIVLKTHTALNAHDLSNAITWQQLSKCRMYIAWLCVFKAIEGVILLISVVLRRFCVPKAKECKLTNSYTGTE